ncbi:MAG: hypothetical protein L0H94_16705 [Nitrospira sp.]|nr:hypothetical protein [Nitrospira sp.]
MQKSIVVAFAALCLMGASSLALADDAMKSEMGKMKDEMKAENNSIHGGRLESNNSGSPYVYDRKLSSHNRVS